MTGKPSSFELLTDVVAYATAAEDVLTRYLDGRAVDIEELATVRDGLKTALDGFGLTRRPLRDKQFEHDYSMGMTPDE